jgi:cyclopropane-fatty-acyl-phospholipid synthase
MNVVTEKAVNWTELGLVPDPVIRAGIRRLLESKRREIHSGDIEFAASAVNQFVAHMNQSPIAFVPEVANEQHYEVPAAFFRRVMGENLKYSCCYWPNGVSTLSEAEAAALNITVQRAGIEDGMSVLDLGCGWGSLSFWIARNFPNTSITAITNSRSQRDFIAREAEKRLLGNIDVIVCDMNDFTTDRQFDRVVSVEMFEHMRNWRDLFERISDWLAPDGKFFMHVFCHRSTPYEFVDKGPTDWMSRHFFTGGMMPSADLPLRFPKHLNVEKRWHWNGSHYAKTCNSWLERMDSGRTTIIPILDECYGREHSELWWQRWRIFFMACAELFDYDDGQEWFVGHYVLANAE